MKKLIMLVLMIMGGFGAAQNTQEINDTDYAKFLTDQFAPGCALTDIEKANIIKVKKSCLVLKVEKINNRDVRKLIYKYRTSAADPAQNCPDRKEADMNLSFSNAITKLCNERMKSAPVPGPCAPHCWDTQEVTYDFYKILPQATGGVDKYFDFINLEQPAQICDKYNVGKQIIADGKIHTCLASNTSYDDLLAQDKVNKATNLKTVEIEVLKPKKKYSWVSIKKLWDESKQGYCVSQGFTNETCTGATIGLERPSECDLMKCVRLDETIPMCRDPHSSQIKDCTLATDKESDARATRINDEKWEAERFKERGPPPPEIHD